MEIKLIKRYKGLVDFRVLLERKASTTESNQKGSVMHAKQLV